MLFRSNVSFDAIVCIETIEHAIDIKTLLYCLGSKLSKKGKLFIHSIIHDYKSYIHDATEEGNSNWMMRNFFSGGSILAKCSYANYLCPSNLNHHNDGRSIFLLQRTLTQVQACLYFWTT